MLWIAWWDVASRLRPAFKRLRTFLWFAAALAATCVRADLRGVTSLVRALGLKEACYERLLDFFHSPAVDLDRLARAWTALVLRLLRPRLLTVNGRIVLLADGIKVPKSGRKMPAVKRLHQESQNNTKPEFISGHSCQAIAVVVCAASSFFALPLASRIHEGAVFGPPDRRSLLDKLVALFVSLGVDELCYLVADTYYAAASIIRPLLKTGQHLVSAVRNTAVAFEPVPPSAVRGPGRPRIYGKRRKLQDLFGDERAFAAAASPIYGERDVTLLLRSVVLYWKPAGALVRFVLVNHPVRGRKILFCTDLSLPPIDVIRLYGVRFKIELSFKQSLHVLGAYAYHFWMGAMKPRPLRSGNQYLHREPEPYRRQVRRKLAAYHCHIQIGLIAQGLLQTLAVQRPRQVWRSFGSWLRTARPGRPPSEFVVALALRHGLPEFLAGTPETHALAKFIRQRVDLDRAEGFHLVA